MSCRQQDDDTVLEDLIDVMQLVMLQFTPTHP